MLRTVVPLVGSERRRGFVIHEFVALALGWSGGRGHVAERRAGLVPGFATIVGALNHLPEPAAALRSVDAIGIDRRSLQVIQLPSGKMRSAYLPLLALAVRRKYECSLARAYQYTN